MINSTCQVVSLRNIYPCPQKGNRLLTPLPRRKRSMKKTRRLWVTRMRKEREREREREKVRGMMRAMSMRWSVKRLATVLGLSSFPLYGQ